MEFQRNTQQMAEMLMEFGIDSPEKLKELFEPNYFAVIPMDVLERKDLNANEKLLYGEISGLTKRAGYCSATDRYIAERIGLSRNSIQKLLQKLDEKGLIRRDTHKTPKGTFRKIYLTWRRTPSSPEGDSRPPDDTSQVSPDRAKGVAEWGYRVSPDSGTKREIEKNKFKLEIDKEKESSHPTLSHAEIGSIDPRLQALARKKDQAEELYSLYPKRVEKAAAISEILKALDKETFETLREAVVEYANSAHVRTTEKQFLPKPVNWFRGECWKDDRAVWEKQRNNGVYTPPERTLERYSTEDKIKKYGHLFKVYEWTENGPCVKSSSGQALENGVKASNKPVKDGKIAK